ncbi:MAG: stage 0 sporulation protein [Desulfobacteraceae bacterium]|nr:MAG: stage 0 sporulation protein [Desulfobacteraceae bacterium]
MSKIVDIQFKANGKAYHFDSGHFVLRRGNKVIVETEMGLALGIVCSEPRTHSEESPERSFKKIIRMAGKQDLDRYDKKCSLEKEAYAFCLEKCRERLLDMGLVAVEAMLDGSKIIIYFSAEGRVDFRELVKDMVQKFRTRIEMKQIGVRYQAKMVGGIGTCGRQLCCTSFLNNFEPVSIKMAKEQNLSLNPTKISGMCGRLMCCLSYEYGYYSKSKKHIPKIGKRAVTPQGEGKVIRQNVLTETITVLLESGEEVELTFDDFIQFQAHKENQPGKTVAPDPDPKNGPKPEPNSHKTKNEVKES